VDHVDHLIMCKKMKTHQHRQHIDDHV
jgi:hypothetical protein